MIKCAVVFLSFALASAPAQPVTPPAETTPSAAPVPVLTVQPAPAKKTVPRQEDETTRELESVRLAGSATAGVGTGMLGYAVVAEAFGPVGWAAALIFIGGMTAYLAHRGLQGENDFKTKLIPPPPRPAAPQTQPQQTQPRPPAQPPETTTPSM